MDKTKLKIGDLIRFHDWGIGGYLFGVIIEKEDEIFHSKLNIWRPRDVYYLQSHGIDNIRVINNIGNVKSYEKDEFYKFLNVIKNNNIFCKFVA